MELSDLLFKCLLGIICLVLASADVPQGPPVQDDLSKQPTQEKEPPNPPSSSNEDTVGKELITIFYLYLPINVTIAGSFGTIIF